MRYYSHDIYLIERTKLLEGILCQSLCFTNTLERAYTNNARKRKAANFDRTQPIGSSRTEMSDDYIKSKLNNLVISPVALNVKTDVPTPFWIGETIRNGYNFGINPPVFITVGELTVEGGTSETSADYSISLGGNTNDYVVVTPTSSNMTLKYKLTLDSGGTTPHYQENLTFMYSIYAVENRLPSKPWSITDCINRILELCEPLQKRDVPRFKLQGVNYDEYGNRLADYESGSLAEKYDNILAPEFTMTQCTLREQLKVIGSYIHAEPRLGYRKSPTEFEENTIVFDEYGKDEESPLTDGSYTYRGLSQSINEYCTDVTTNATNIVNSLNYAQGVILDPNATNTKTLRTDSVNVMLTQSNAKISTQLPIYKLIKVECGVLSASGTGWARGPWNITDYVFEAHEYNSILSSYGGTYPYSKSFAIYYTQGQKDIDGLFFKSPDNVIDEYLNNYAITNILEAVSNEDLKEYIVNYWNYLSFRVTYIPIYNTKFSHGKQLIIKGSKPFTAVYGQSENIIETSYFGEDIKVVAQRLGNVGVTKTFILPDASFIPKTGQRMGNYIISAVTSKFTHKFIKCTVALTKDFNRISQYVGINSNKRISEVSEREAYLRDILIKEYVLIGNPDNTLPRARIIRNVRYFCFNIATSIRPMNVVVSDISNKAYQIGTNRTCLPVVSSAFGNTMVFSWTYKDNYSAGTRLQNIEDANGDVKQWQTDIPYSDYYGRAYWYDFTIANSIANRWLAQANDISSVENPLEIPSSIRTSTSDSGKPYLLRKDSREALNFNYCIEHVSNRSDLIIGSAMASFNSLISNVERLPPFILCYIPSGSNEKFNKFDANIENKFISVSDYELFEMLSVDVIDDYTANVTIDFKNLKGTNFNGWCIAYESRYVTKNYADEDGNVVPVSILRGGEILLSSNNPISYYADKDYKETFTISLKNKIYL